MKKSLFRKLAFMTLAASLVLTACSGSKDANETNTTAALETSEAQSVPDSQNAATEPASAPASAPVSASAGRTDIVVAVSSDIQSMDPV